MATGMKLSWLRSILVCVPRVELVQPHSGNSVFTMVTQTWPWPHLIIGLTSAEHCMRVRPIFLTDPVSDCLSRDDSSLLGIVHRFGHSLMLQNFMFIVSALLNGDSSIPPSDLFRRLLAGWSMNDTHEFLSEHPATTC